MRPNNGLPRAPGIESGDNEKAAPAGNGSLTTPTNEESKMAMDSVANDQPMSAERRAEIRRGAQTLTTGSTGVAGWDGGHALITFRPRIESDQQMSEVARLAEELPEILVGLLDEVDRLQAALATVTNTEALEGAIKAGIGYGLVPLSIRDHPEITLEYRSIKDRDGLLERIVPRIVALANGGAE